MATQTQANVIQVPALMDGNKVVIPQFWLAGNVEYRTDREYNAFSAAKYKSQMTLPTLAELRHAFFGESEDYRKSVLSNYGYGEWTSTFLQDGKRAVENPKNVVYRNGVWVPEGGKVIAVELPPEGWILEYDNPTGFPSRTSPNREDAKKVFGNNTSYFYRINNDVRVVMWYFGIGDDVQFYVNASFGPDHRNSFIGGRMCYRSEQAANETVVQSH